MPICPNQEIFIFLQGISRQAGAELGQAQLKLRLDFYQIQHTFAFSLFDLMELVGWALYFKLD